MKELDRFDIQIGKVPYYESKEKLELLQCQNLMYKHLLEKYKEEILKINLKELKINKVNKKL